MLYRNLFQSELTQRMTLLNRGGNHHHTCHKNKLQCTNNTDNNKINKTKLKEEFKTLVASIMYRLIIHSFISIQP